MDKLPVSVVIIAKNEERMLPDCLKSVEWAEELIVVDDASTDQTREIAKSYGAEVFERKMDNEGAQRNFAYGKAMQPWILSIDADERVSPELAENIKMEIADGGDCAGYAIPIRNFIGTRQIKAAGYYPSYRMRFFRNGYLKYEEAGVHPRAFGEGKRGILKGDLIHYGCRDLTHFVDKLNRQTTLEAEKWIEDRRPMSMGKILFKIYDRFSRHYFRKKGFTDGFLGFLMSVFHAVYQFFTYVKYLELKNIERAKV